MLIRALCFYAQPKTGRYGYDCIEPENGGSQAHELHKWLKSPRIEVNVWFTKWVAPSSCRWLREGEAGGSQPCESAPGG